MEEQRRHAFKAGDRTMDRRRHGRPQGVGKRWRGWYVGDDGKPRTKRFRTEVEAEGWSNAQRGKVFTNQWVSPDLGADAFANVAEQWFRIGRHCKPKTVAGYRSILDTLVLPRWGDMPLKAITYGELSAWLSGLSVDGSQAGTALSASRIIQTHQLIGAVYKYAVKAGLASKNVAAEIERRHDLPKTGESASHYLTHRQLLDLARETGRFEAMTLVLGYCGLRFGEAAALRRKDIGDREITVRSSATYVAGRASWKRALRRTGAAMFQCPRRSGSWSRLSYRGSGRPDVPSRTGGHLSNHQYRRAFDKALRVVQTTAKTKRQQEIARTAKRLRPTSPTSRRNTYATPAPPSPSLPGRTSKSFSGCLATPQRR